MIEVNLTKPEREIVLIELLNRKQKLVGKLESNEQLEKLYMYEIKETENLINKLLK